MKTREIAIEKSQQLFDWFMDVRKEFPEVTLHKSSESGPYEVYFIGNKIVGTDYELDMWKKIPLMECRISKYTSNHPTMKDEFYLEFRLSFRGSASSDDWKMDEELFKLEVRKAFLGAINSFIVCEI